MPVKTFMPTSGGLLDTYPYTSVTGLSPVAMELFAESLRKAREERGLTQTQLAELLGITLRVYNRWERGAAVPRLDSIVQLADILQLSLDQLVGRSSTNPALPKLRHPKLQSLYEQVDRLSAEDQKALIILLDSLLKRSEIGRVLAQ